MILVNILIRDEKKIIAICDKELLGKKYKSGEICIDLQRYRKFYEGKDPEEIPELEENIKSAYSINAFGKESIDFLEKIGFDTSKCVLIGKKKIPHIQIYRL